MSKYKNKITYIDGIKFDSKKEANRYNELKLLEKAGEIKELTLQPSFELIPTVRKNGRTYCRTQYIADFMYLDVKEDKYIVEDVKGFKTDVFKLKEKLFNYIYDLELRLI